MKTLQSAAEITSLFQVHGTVTDIDHIPLYKKILDEFQKLRLLR